MINDAHDLSRRRLIGGALGLGAAAAIVETSPAAAEPSRHGAGSPHPDAIVSRDGRSHTVSFTSRGGELLLDLTAWAPGVDWQSIGRESAIASIDVDGRYATDLLVPFDTPLQRELQLGGVAAGEHQLRFTFAADRSAPRSRAVHLAKISVRTVTTHEDDYIALAHAPILYGRSLSAYGGAFQNAWTDAPLVAWHYTTPQTNGNTMLEYQMVWSNEDGGTDTEPPAEQARWGRMTDIEWIYRVEVTPSGATVPGSETFQAPSHVTTQFHGTHEGQHPVLQTCTDNNNVCDQLTDAKMRFFLSYRPTMDAATQAREQIMDAFPWTYAVMGKEMIREQHTEKRANPLTAQLSDARNYLYIVIDKITTPASSSTPWVGTSIGVRLRRDPQLYRSDHHVPNWSLQRDGLGATTVELPVGTSMRDIVGIDAIRFPTSVRSDPGSTVTVSAITRAYLLDRHYQPIHPFITWHGRVTLTKSDGQATLWRR